MDEKSYPTDIWEYLVDMPYMPSRQDRDQLVQAGDEKRVMIWDYFFRINPDHVGKPQKKEIIDIEKHISETIKQYIQRRQEYNAQIKTFHYLLFQKRLRNFLYGIGNFVIAGIIFKIATNYLWILKYGYFCGFSILTIGVILLLSIGFVGWNEKKAIKNLQRKLKLLSDDHEIFIREQIQRKNVLRCQIRTLKSKIPLLPPHEMIRQWLHDDLFELSERSKEVTALGNRLVPIESGLLNEDGSTKKHQGLIPVFGPGELQHPDKIPLTFSNDVNPDLYKHLTVKKSFVLHEFNRIEVLYGLYYLEHILIADDMLATYGLFYDFISGKSYSEQITEQYYQDVVAITTTHEFRKIPLSIFDQDATYVEDAPTFTLSLASGEHRTVTFVSEGYFLKIRERINVSENDVSRIYWIGNSLREAELAGKALRSQLRLHKVVLKDD